MTADGTNSFSYDGTGNRTAYTTGTGNRLEYDGTWYYYYNAEGALTKRTKGGAQETWSYGYDNENRLEWVEKRDADGLGGNLLLRIEFTNDAFGNRVQKKVDSDGNGTIDTTQRYSFDGWNPAKPSPIGNENWDVWADLDGSSSLTTRYLRGDIVDQVFARLDAGTAYWTLTDRQGSIRDVIDNSAVVKSHLDYDGFGNIVTETGSAFSGRYGNTGREREKEAQLQANHDRWYYAPAGRWTTEDPEGFRAGDSNLYRYVHNNYPNRTDPSGRVAPLVAIPAALITFLITPRSLTESDDVWFGRMFLNAAKVSTAGLLPTAPILQKSAAFVGGFSAAGQVADQLDYQLMSKEKQRELKALGLAPPDLGTLAGWGQAGGQVLDETLTFAPAGPVIATHKRLAYPLILAGANETSANFKEGKVFRGLLTGGSTLYGGYKLRHQAMEDIAYIQRYLPPVYAPRPNLDLAVLPGMTPTPPNGLIGYRLETRLTGCQHADLGLAPLRPPAPHPHLAFQPPTTLAHTPASRWAASQFSFLGRYAPRTIPEAIAYVRARHGLNCTLCVAELETLLPGGRVRPVGGAGMQHEVYHYQGSVIDPTARQYVLPARAGVWTEQELIQAGLRDAVDSGVFTPEQHIEFLRGLNRRFPGTIED